MPKGQVKWFDPKKGYGFIIGPDGQDVFVHYSHIQSEGFRALKDGEWVDYELVEGDKGYQARNVAQSEGAQSSQQHSTSSAPASRGYEAGPPPTDAPPEPPPSSGYTSADDESP